MKICKLPFLPANIYIYKNDFRIRQNAALYQKYYRGPLTVDQAEEMCPSRSQWILYHRSPITIREAARSYSEKRDFPTMSELFIVYRRADTGQHE